MQHVLHKIQNWFRAEPILILSTLFAMASMVWIPPTTAYFAYIDFKTLCCLFCLMASVMGLQREGILERMALSLCSRMTNSRVLTFFLVFACYVLSTLVTNDVALITIIPITLAILSACELGAWSAYIVVLQTIAANIGSAMTPFGNPQNLYLFTRYHFGLSDFFAAMLPIGLWGGILLAVSCFLIPLTPLKPLALQQAKPVQRKKLLLYCAFFFLSVAAVFDWLPYPIVTVILVAILIATDRKTLAKVDYSLLATFFLIFVFVGNLGNIPSVHAFLSSLTHQNTFLASVLSSQVISNVPAAILLSGFTDRAQQLLIGMNVGGLGTLIASMASVISYRIYTSTYKEGTLRYLKLFTFWNVLFLALMCAFVSLYPFYA